MSLEWRLANMEKGPVRHEGALDWNERDERVKSTVESKAASSMGD